jgi:hypothetical protein
VGAIVKYLSEIPYEEAQETDKPKNARSIRTWAAEQGQFEFMDEAP